MVLLSRLHQLFLKNSARVNPAEYESVVVSEVLLKDLKKIKGFVMITEFQPDLRAT